MLDSNNSFARTSTPSSAPPFLVDRDMVVRDTGIQIDWDDLDAEDYEGTATTGKFLKAGTVLALKDNGKAIPRDIIENSETAYGILATNASEHNNTDAVTGYGVIRSGSIYENLLPEATGTPKEIESDWKDELIAAGGFWMFEQYSDNT